MKKSLSYLLLITLLVFFVSACSSDDIVNQEDNASTYDTYIILRADAGDGQVTLEWTYESSASTYNIYYIQAATQPTYDELKANGTKIVGTDVTPNIISAPYVVVTGLENGKKYYFSVTGVNSSGVEYNLATPTYATPTSPAPLPAPEDVRANAGNEKVTVTWTPVTGADYYVIECYWQEGTSADIGYVIVAGGSTGSQVVDSDSITWTIDTTAGIINDRTYYFDVCAIENGTDTISDDDDIQSSASFTVWATPSATPPLSAPTNLTVTEEGDKFVNLWWDDVAGATSYDVYIGTAKNMRKDKYQYWYKIVGPSDEDPPASGIIIPKLENDTTYYFLVTAINNNGTTEDTSDDLESAESNEESATPTAP